MRKLTICGTDIAEFALVTKADPNPAEKTAALFLQRVIQASCGAVLPISATAEHGIFIGTRDACDEVKWDGFRTTTDDKNLYLDGNIPRGTLYAAYDFAEKYLDYRFFATDRVPGNDTERIVTEGEAEIPCGLDAVDNPAFGIRRSDFGGFDDKEEYCAHARLNVHKFFDRISEAYGSSPTWPLCHTMGTIFCHPTKYYKDHPEYYSLWEGERLPTSGSPTGYNGQLCLTNPDVLRIVTEEALELLRQNPNMEILDISHADNQRFCTCEKCAAVDAKEESHAGTMLRFINAIAEEVEKEFPNVLVQTFAYQYTSKPPKYTKARKNVLIRYCTMDACFRHPITDPNCPTNSTRFYKEMIEWKSKCHQLSVWDYVTNYLAYIAPFPNLRSIRENLRFFSECGATTVYEEDAPYCTTNGVYGHLRVYLLTKLMWNPHMTEEEFNTHMDEFLENYYGAGWREIKKYIDLEHDVTSDREMPCFGAPMDISSAFTCPGMPNIKEFIAAEYEPKAYQPAYPDHYLTGLCARIEEAKALFDRAYDMAETELQKKHGATSRLPVTYLDLFCIDHDKNKMSEEEQKAYEAACEQFRRDKVEAGLFYNIYTANNRMR